MEGSRVEGQEAGESMTEACKVWGRWGGSNGTKLSRAWCEGRRFVTDDQIIIIIIIVIIIIIIRIIIGRVW